MFSDTHTHTHCFAVKTKLSGHVFFTVAHFHQSLIKQQSWRFCGIKPSTGNVNQCCWDRSYHD